MTQPGWIWRRLYDQAEALGDAIGSNDPDAANMAYALAARLKQHLDPVDTAVAP